MNDQAGFPAQSRSRADVFWSGSAVGLLARKHDWSASPLGDPDDWPQPLRTLVGVMLGSAQPMFVTWGPRRAMFYNDSYAGILGIKHPGALGRPFSDVWPEIEADVAPIMDRAYAGEPTQMDDIQLMLERSGYPEEMHFSFSYTPVRGTDGTVQGMFCCCTETTAQVLTDRRRVFLLGLGDLLRDQSSTGEVMARATAALGHELRVDAVGYCEADPSLEHVDMLGTWRADGTPGLAGRHRLDDYGPAMVRELKAGRAAVIVDSRHDELTAGMGALAQGGTGALAQMNLPLIQDRRLVGLLFVHSAVPRQWRPEEVALAEELAERLRAAAQRGRAERELRDNEERYRLIVESAREYAIVMIGQDGLINGWNPGAERILGHSEADILARPFATLFTPEDIASGAPGREMHTAETEGRAADERWHMRKDGSRFWGSGLTMPLADKARGGFVKIFRDMTEERAAQQERDGLLAALEAEKARLRAVFEAVPVGLIVAEAPSGRIVDGNRRVESIVRHSVGPSGVESYRDWVSFHADGRQVLPDEYPLARVIQGGEERPELEALFSRGDGTEAWLRLVAAPIRDGKNHIRGGVMAMLDIDQRKRAIEALEAARDRQRLLIDELNHRVKNTLATVQSLAQQSLRSADTPEAFAAAFGDRLRGLASAHDLLTREAWEGATLGDIAAASLGPWLTEGRASLQGPPVRVAPRQALALSMAFGELTTNAAKHGALSGAGGRVVLTWRLDGEIAAEWREEGGPAVAVPARRGLGSRLLGKPLAGELGGTLALQFEPAGVRCLFRFPAAPAAPGNPGHGTAGARRPHPGSPW